MLKITFRQLEIFAAIAKTQNISAAAETVHLSQSALSMSLTTFEHQLGGKLFERAGKRLILNTAGKELLPKVLDLVQQAKRIEATLLTQENELHGNLDIGASTTIGNYLLPALVVKFMQQNPKTSIKLKVENTAHIIQEVVKFNLDMGVIEGICSHPEITVVPWTTDRLVVVAAPQHPLARKRELSLTQLLAAQWIMRERGSGTREIFERAIGPGFHTFLELGHTEAIKQAVITGVGISCLSELAIRQAVKNKQLVILKTPFLKLTREFYLLFHKKKYKTAVLNQFMQYCLLNFK